MKKIIIAVLVLISVESFGQLKLYAVKLNTNGTTDSFFVKPATPGIFNNLGHYVMPVVDSMLAVEGFEMPNSLGKFFLGRDGVSRNFSDKMLWTGLVGTPSTFTATATTIGTNLLAVNNPVSNSLPVFNSSGGVILRTEAQIRSDLLINNVDNTSDASKPVSTATQTALNLKQDIATNTGGWMVFTVTGSNATTTGQVLTDITGLVSGTLANATKYEVELILDVGTSAVTTGCQYGIQTGGTGGAGVVSGLLVGTTTVNAATTVTLSAPGAAVGTFLTTSGTSGTITFRGWVTTRGTGTATISAQHLKVTSGTSTVRIGSKMRIRLAL